MAKRKKRLKFKVGDRLWAAINAYKYTFRVTNVDRKNHLYIVINEQTQQYIPWDFNRAEWAILIGDGNEIMKGLLYEEV